MVRSSFGARLDLGLNRCRSSRRIAGLLRQPLAHERERHEGGQPLGVSQVRRRIRVWPPRKQSQRADDLIADLDRNLQAGLQPTSDPGTGIEKLRLARLR
jgi:hypothetical protein